MENRKHRNCILTLILYATLPADAQNTLKSSLGHRRNTLNLQNNHKTEPREAP